MKVFVEYTNEKCETLKGVSLVTVFAKENDLGSYPEIFLHFAEQGKPMLAIYLHEIKIFEVVKE